MSSKPTTQEDKPTLLMKATMEAAREVRCADGIAVVFSRTSPAKDTPNEDAAAVLPLWDGTAVLVVADGVGGMRAGHKASSAAIRAIKSSLSDAKPGDDLRPFILDGIERANDRILKSHGGSATTIAVVELSNGYMRPYHVGDSIILQVSNRGDIRWSALSHAPVSYAVESGLISEEAGMLHPERNMISNVVGDRDMRIEIGPRRKLAAQDTIVVASDGLCDNLSTHEIADYVRRSPLAEKSQHMIEATNRRMQLAMEGLMHPDMPGKPDDLTVLTYRIERRKKPRKPNSGNAIDVLNRAVVESDAPPADQDSPLQDFDLHLGSLVQSMEE